MAAVVGAATAGALLLHRSAVIERQTLRTQELGGLAFQLQDFVSRAEIAQGVSPSLAAGRARALAGADAALRWVQDHDGDAGLRIRASYVPYARASGRAFRVAASHGGQVPAAQQQALERGLARLEARIDGEVQIQGRATRVTNPEARFALIAAAVAAGLLVALLIWQFEMQRRAGKIDRDNVERSEELMRQKDDFAAAVSHELRTPLTSILGYLELIEDSTGTRSEEDDAYLAVVRRNAERLLRLVSDLLLVAEVEDSMLALRFVEVDIGDLARECVQAAKPAADRRGIRLSLETGPAAVLQGDPIRLAQMMDNLVSNAIKFTPSGGRVTVTTAMRDGRAEFEVRDSGQGISEADQAHLYDRFFRTRDAAVQATPGTGLGLTITKAIVDAHGGAIAVTSALGAGTTFSVVLPSPGGAPARGSADPATASI